MRQCIIYLLVLFLTSTVHCLADDTGNVATDASCNLSSSSAPKYYCRTLLINLDNGKAYQFKMRSPSNREVLCGWRVITNGENLDYLKISGDENNNSFIGLADSSRGKVYIRLQVRWIAIFNEQMDSKNYENCFVDGFSDVTQDSEIPISPVIAAGCHRFVRPNKIRYIKCR
jgi:hypothetical protein